MAANQTVNIYGRISPRYIKQVPTSKRQEVYGLGFPLGSSKDGGIFSKKTGVTLIRRYLFQPLDESTFEGIKREIQYSFRNYIVGAKIAKLLVYPLGEAGPAGGNSLKVVLSLQLDSADLEQFDVEVDIS